MTIVVGVGDGLGRVAGSEVDDRHGRLGGDRMRRLPGTAAGQGRDGIRRGDQADGDSGRKERCESDGRPMPKTFVLGKRTSPTTVWSVMGWMVRTPACRLRTGCLRRCPLNSAAVQKYTDGQLKWVIDHGISPSGMPASKGILGDEEIWQIVDYIRHLPPKGSLGEPEVYGK
jgi:hypothetical protein